MTSTRDLGADIRERPEGKLEPTRRADELKVERRPSHKSNIANPKKSKKKEKKMRNFHEEMVAPFINGEVEVAEEALVGVISREEMERRAGRRFRERMEEVKRERGRYPWERRREQ